MKYHNRENHYGKLRALRYFDFCIPRYIITYLYFVVKRRDIFFALIYLLIQPYSLDIFQGSIIN